MIAVVKDRGLDFTSSQSRPSRQFSYQIRYLLRSADTERELRRQLALQASG